MKNISLVTESLENVTGGADGWQGSFSGPWMTVCNITSGYLALRTDHFRDENNEIGNFFLAVFGGGEVNGHHLVGVGDASCHSCKPLPLKFGEKRLLSYSVGLKALTVDI